MPKMLVKESEPNNRKELDIFQRTDIKARLKQTFSKGVAIVNEIDPVLGPEVFETWKAWRLAETNIQSKFEEYKSLDEYVEARIHDIGYPYIHKSGFLSLPLTFTIY